MAGAAILPAPMRPLQRLLVRAAVEVALESVPPGAATEVAPVVRLNAGVDPTTAQWTDLLHALEDIPGVEPARVTVQTISTELHPKDFFDPVGPVLTGDRGSAPVRLFGVDEMATRCGERAFDGASR